MYIDVKHTFTMEQPRSIMALFHKFRLVLNFDQRCSRHEPSVPKREVTASHPRLPPRPATTRGCSGSLFKSSPIFFDRENTELDPVLRHLFRRSFRAAVYISRVCRKITRRKSPCLQTFSSKKTTLFLALRSEHYLQGILEIFLCSNAAIFKEAISHR